VLAANSLDKLARFFRNSPDMKTSIPPILITFSLVCFALVQNAQAVNPPPDGGYPGGNTAEGQNALLNLTSGIYNTALGIFSLESNTTGNLNTGVGVGTLLANAADENTATGAGALLNNTTGSQNTANGAFTLFNNTEGGSNTANGFEALFNNTTGPANTATGYQALLSNTIGGTNTANGYRALASNTTGVGNTAIGNGALDANISGDNNIALGVAAGTSVITASNVIAIGSTGANVSDSCYIDNIHGATSDPGTTLAVGVDASGKLGTTVSSRRFKHDIKPIDKASEAILALKPMTFHYKSDTKGTPQFGLIAEEVAEVNQDLIVRDKKGEILSVRYDAVNAMLLNEFLKEHRKNQEQEATITQQRKDFEAAIAQQQKEIEALTATVKEQASQIHRVSAQLEASKPAPQVVGNP